MRRPLLAALAACVAGVILALMAAGVRLISDAHGHGLASADRRAIILLAVSSAACFAVALGVYLRGR